MPRDALSLDQAMRVAADGLRLCLAGDEAAGLAAYRSIARPRLFAHLPLGLHVRMLEEAGREAARDALTALTVRWGGDLAWRARREGASPALAAEEYEGWIARGRVNPVMMNRYLGALTQLGRTADIAALLDPALIRRTRLGEMAGVVDALLALETAPRTGPGVTARNMSRVYGLEQRAEFAALMAACEEAFAGYFADWRASGHRLAPLAPGDFTLGSWALISRENGHADRHQHQVGWATAVYYPIGLDAEEPGGALRIGGWEDPAPPGWPDVAIRPEAGLLAIFPSWYVHWTEPLMRPGLRLSVAFDAIPVWG